MRRKLSGTLFAVLGLMLWAGAALAATLVGTVVGVSGTCTARGRALKSGDAVQVGDRIDIPAAGELKLHMADGSVISLAPGSSMMVASYNAGGGGRSANLLLRQGLLRAAITPAGGSSTFEVSTAVGTASVRSVPADWFIEAQPGSSRVGVLQGSVDLTSAATKRSISIPAHWGARLEAERDPVLPRVWSQVEFNAVIRLTECCQPPPPKVEPPPLPAR
jgi:hypothetical protein